MDTIRNMKNQTIPFGDPGLDTPSKNIKKENFDFEIQDIDNNERVVEKDTLNKAKKYLTLDDAKQNLKEYLCRIKNDNRKTTGEIKINIEKLKNLTISENNNEELNNKYLFFQDLQFNVKMICDCIHEKTPLIEKFSKRMTKLRMNHFEKINNYYISELDKQYQFEIKNVPYEFNISAYNEIIKEFNDKKSKIKEKSRLIFKDVKDEFKNYSHILKLFKECRDKYNNNYRSAWIPTSLPVIIAPFVGFELIGCDLINITRFSDENWYKMLKSFSDSVIENNLNLQKVKLKNEIQNVDVTNDKDILKTIFKSVFLPIIKEIVIYEWDAYSYKDTNKIYELFINIYSEYFANEKEISDIIFYDISGRLIYNINNLMNIVVKKRDESYNLTVTKINYILELTKSYIKFSKLFCKDAKDTIKLYILDKLSPIVLEYVIKNKYEEKYALIIKSVISGLRDVIIDLKFETYEMKHFLGVIEREYAKLKF